MTRFKKGEDGKYHIHGNIYEMITGSRAQVWHKTAYETTGGLKKKDLMMNKHGRIVSIEKHKTAKKEKRLVKAGYFTKKGKFGFIKTNKKTQKTGGKYPKSFSRSRGGSLTPLKGGIYPDSVGMVSSTESGAVFPTTLGGTKKSSTLRKMHKGGNLNIPLNPSSFPFGENDNPTGLGSVSQQSFLVSPNNTPQDLALLKGGTGHGKLPLSMPTSRALTSSGGKKHHKK